MHKYIILIYLISLNAMAEEIRLSCNMLIKSMYFNGHSESRKETVFADIDFEGSNFSAQLKGTEFIFSISSSSFKNKYSTTEILGNNSNDNKWDITTITTMSEANIESENYIYLDRNSGKINVRSELTRNNRKTTTIGSGMCDKINTKSKKF